MGTGHGSIEHDGSSGLIRGDCHHLRQRRREEKLKVKIDTGADGSSIDSDLAFELDLAKPLNTFNSSISPRIP